MPKGYMIVQSEIHDPEAFKAYIAAAPAVVAKFGGRYLVRGGAITHLEGEWRPKRLTVVEFPSAETARAFHASPEYQACIKLREGNATFHMTVVEGAE